MDNYLEHHGVKGMHWGVRRYQNSDGSLTSEGKAHYKTGEPRKKKLSPEQKEKAMKIVKAGAVSTAAVLTTYGLYKTGKAEKFVKSGKDVMKKMAKNAGKGFVDGLPEGAYGAGKMLGKALVGGVTWMAGIEVADLATNGAATQKILKAYNDHQKKDNKVKTSYRNNSRGNEDD